MARECDCGFAPSRSSPVGTTGRRDGPGVSGVALARLGRHDEAQAAFKKALAQEPNRETPWLKPRTSPTRRDDTTRPSPCGGVPSPSAPCVRNITASWLLPCFRLATGAKPRKKAARPCVSARPIFRARELLVRCELRLKDREAALKEFRALLEFDPPNRDDLIRRFADPCARRRPKAVNRRPHSRRTVGAGKRGRCSSRNQISRVAAIAESDELHSPNGTTGEKISPLRPKKRSPRRTTALPSAAWNQNRQVREVD